jgi:hypothetical protein
MEKIMGYNIAGTLATKISHVDLHEMVFRHIVVTLTERDNLATFREDPSRWTSVQSAQHTRVKRGDRISLVSHDGLVIHDSYVVTKAEGGSVWLNDKPLRIISLEEDALFSDGVATVLWLLASGFLVGSGITRHIDVLWAGPCPDLSEEKLRQGLPEGFPEGVRRLTREECLNFRRDRQNKLAQSGIVVLGPPLGVLGLGFVAFWVVRGFRRR